ncbi:hypothetical protein [Bauldia sp.]|uniref:hypothetical protein n=1 Tax=Bauldia sp. TaxID=2575872 RepID=UPI003BA8AABC
MPLTDDPLAFNVFLGLNKGLKRIRRDVRRDLSEEQRKRIAEAIVDHLRRSNWRFERGPPAVGAGAILTGALAKDDEES